MMFSTEESKMDTNFQTPLLSNTELLHKSQQKTCVVGTRKIFYTSLPILTENTEKTCIYNLIYLTSTFFFVLSKVNLADISSACNSPRFKLPV